MPPRSRSTTAKVDPFGVFEIPPPASHLPENRFRFRLGDEVLSVPKMDYVSHAANEWLNTPGSTAMSLHEFALQFMQVVEPEVGEKVIAAKLERDQVLAIYNAWSEAGKVTAGKSERSANS